ncbi:MAG: excinuclease ABC subunit UvrC [Alphaproteobacteria bacterium]|nr:excinuclease ABC subunit UvrC [Alphaproteobacteria bacterium]
MKNSEISSGESLARGRSVIEKYLATLPGSAGVYRMLGSDGNVLYVGKAKNLKNRVASYLQVEAMNTRLQRMVSQTVAMEVVTTRSEAEALLLEANLIKKYSPRYNVLLRDDKSFPYIFFSGDHEFSRIEKHRGAKTKKGKYFGPFVSAGAVNETITLLQKAFLLRPCSDNIFKNRTRPCLQYQIKRCSAPCVGKIGKEEYAKLASQAMDFLSGKSTQIQEELIAQMQELSSKMLYEKARAVRDRIRAIASVQQQHGLSVSGLGDADVIALARGAGDSCCIQMFSFRGGRNYGTKTWFPTGTAAYSDGEVLRNFIGQFYQSQPAPALILVSSLIEEAALIEEALRLHSDYKIEIVTPLRGDKRDIIELAQKNAREALARDAAMHQTQRAVLEGVQKLFGLDDLPKRIEVYDNSHISGTNAVGAMIVAGPEGFIKSAYRQFDIKREETAPGDDYAMMREVLTRRFKRMQEAANEKDAVRPDLVLIDGGAGQLSIATQVFEELGVQGVAYVGIAKGPDRNAGREQFFIPGREPFQLPMDDAVLHYLQRLRDEAHRFAIGAHRGKRSKSMQTSELDSIPLIGPTRKKALLMHFGSAKAVAAASMEEIAKVEGISHSTAKVIYEFFHG